MNYIRTKDRIFRITATPQNNAIYRDSQTYRIYDHIEMVDRDIMEKDIINKADTIEELGDCFIAVDKNGNLCENPMIAKGHCFKSFCNYYKANGIDVDCYLAILTDEGLIYKAKMNEKRELELL